jgi:hypothetical protein
MRSCSADSIVAMCFFSLNSTSLMFSKTFFR